MARSISARRLATGDRAARYDHNHGIRADGGTHGLPVGPVTGQHSHRVAGAAILPKLNVSSVKIEWPASWTNRLRCNNLQYSLLMHETAPRGGGCRERNSDCFGDHRCAGGLRNCRTRTGPSRTISFHPIWVRPQRRALRWVRATLQVCGILLRLSQGLRTQ
jgi:hypothetical protein